MTSADDPKYDAIMHAFGSVLGKNESDSAEWTARYGSKKEQVEAIQAQLRQFQDQLSGTAKDLKTGVPDLRASAEEDPPPADTDIDAELAEADRWSRLAADHHRDLLDAARLPPVAPGSRPLLRNTFVYGIAMVCCFGVQLVLASGMEDGWFPANAWLWVGFLLPVVFLIAGYVATGFAGSPKLPTVDASGEPIPFTVYKSPRLGAVLAVATIIAYLLVA